MSFEVLLTPSPEVVERVRNHYGLTEAHIQESLEALKKWMELLPHLPKVDDNGLLERWLIRCKNSMEKTKLTIDMYYTLRSVSPDYVTDWNTNSAWFKRISSHVYIFTIPQLLPGDCRVVCGGFLAPDTTNFIGEDLLKISLMYMDIRIREDYCLNDVVIQDYKNCTLAHVSKITLAQAKKLGVFTFKGYNMRVKAVHCINVPAYAEILISFLKAASSPKIASRIRVHGSDLTELHKEVPKKYLPNEYGGEAGPISQFWDGWKRKMDSYNERFKELENMKTDESKRPGRSMNSGDLFGIEGSFRNLSVD